MKADRSLLNGSASLLVLSEPITPLTLAAVALILCGLALSQYRGKKRA